MWQQLFININNSSQLSPRENSILRSAKSDQSLENIADSFNIPTSLILRHLENIVLKIQETDKNLAKQINYAYNLEQKEF